jgi:dihydroorotase-like cyclic amidohydrolase
MMPDLILRSSRVVTPEGVRPAAIHIRSGIITEVTHTNELPEGVFIYEAGDSVVMPGLVDSHVHINEPGRADWEGFETATRAAAAGGITTLVDMPLNSIPATTTVAALKTKLSATQGKCRVDVGFWGGVVPENLADLRRLHEAGVLGFKAFLVDSGVPEFPAIKETELRAALAELAALDSVLLVHAELPGPIERAATGRSFALARDWLRTRRWSCSSVAAAKRGPAFTLYTSLPRTRWRTCAARGQKGSPSRPKPARTTCGLPRRRLRKRPPSSSAARPSASAIIVRNSGAPCTTA